MDPVILGRHGSCSVLRARVSRETMKTSPALEGMSTVDALRADVLDEAAHRTAPGQGGVILCR